MRNVTFTQNEHYHLVGRGADKMTIFLENADYVRFLFLILHLQAPLQIKNLSRAVWDFKINHLELNRKTAQNIIAHKEVELVAFCCMPNHFHILAKNLARGGVSRFMHRALTAYSAYFNKKYAHSGHVFQGPFRAIHIKDNTQLLHTSAYIHKNPTKIPAWRNKESHYPWSSYQDAVTKNRWGRVLVPDLILEQFDSPAGYKRFVTTSMAKEGVCKAEPCTYNPVHERP